MKNSRMIKSLLTAVFLLAGTVCAAGEDESLRKYFEEGQKLFDRGEYAQAIKKFEKVVELNGNFAPAYNSLGLAHQQLGAGMADVVWFFKVAVEIDPKYLEAYNNMCRTYHQGEDFDSALAACQQALKINPNYGPAQMSIAWVYLLGKANPDEALGYFRKVLAKTKSPTVYYGMGLAYSRQGDTPRVLEMITELRALGEIDFASQLERSIRRPQSAPAAVATNAAGTSSGPASTIVGPSVAPAVQNAKTGSSPVSGQMQIRLKGQLSNPDGTPAPSAAKNPVPDHPGSLSP